MNENWRPALPDRQTVLVHFDLKIMSQTYLKLQGLARKFQLPTESVHCSIRQVVPSINNSISE